MISQSVASLEYVRVVVGVLVNGNPSYNPTSDVVQMGFVPVSSPQSSPPTWLSASWETVVQGTQTVYVAKCLAGPSPGGTFVPTPGRYIVWVKVQDNPEIPQKPAGTIEFY